MCFLKIFYLNQKSSSREQNTFLFVFGLQKLSYIFCSLEQHNRQTWLDSNCVTTGCYLVHSYLQNTMNKKNVAPGMLILIFFYNSESVFIYVVCIFIYVCMYVLYVCYVLLEHAV